MLHRIDSFLPIVIDFLLVCVDLARCIQLTDQTILSFTDGLFMKKKRLDKKIFSFLFLVHHKIIHILQVLMYMLREVPFQMISIMLKKEPMKTLIQMVILIMKKYLYNTFHLSFLILSLSLNHLSGDKKTNQGFWYCLYSNLILKNNFRFFFFSFISIFNTK